MGEVDGYVTTGVAVLSEGAIFPPLKNKEYTAITISAHNEVRTADPRAVRRLLAMTDNVDLWDRLHANELYLDENPGHEAQASASLWVIPVPHSVDGAWEIHNIPFVNPTAMECYQLSHAAKNIKGPSQIVNAIGNIYHIGTVKLGFDSDQEYWTCDVCPFIGTM